MAMILRVVVCRTILREVEALVEGEGVWVEDVPEACFPGDSPPEIAPGDRGHPTIFLGCEAHRFPKNDPWNRRVGGSHCASLLGGAWITAHIAASRGYAVTPSWVEDWPRRLERWGFDLPLGREFFRGFADRLVLLDSRTFPEAPEKLRECAAALDLGHEILPVGLEPLRLAFREARSSLELEGAEGRVRELRKEAGEAFMAMDLMGQMAELGKEDQVASRLHDLCSLLFDPRSVAYAPRGKGAPKKVWYFPPSAAEGEDPPAEGVAPGGVVREDGGFSLGVAWGGETLGVLRVRGVAVPEYLDRYADLTSRVISRVAGLAVANARSFEALEKTLQDREFLIKEIHHRVKNNLNLVVSLLSLQDPGEQGGALHKALDEAISRVHAIAQIHDFLYRGEDLRSVPLGPYLKALGAHLREFGTEAHGSVTLVISGDEDLSLEPKRAVSCGLMVTELVTNALKYAFPPGGPRPRSPEVRVMAERREGGMVALEVRDNGVAKDQAPETPKGSSLGTLLVNALTQQLEGTVVRSHTEEGYTVTLLFPEKEEG